LARARAPRGIPIEIAVIGVREGIARVQKQKKRNYFSHYNLQVAGLVAEERGISMEMGLGAKCEGALEIQRDFQ
jgi:hypothetical protein